MHAVQAPKRPQLRCPNPSRMLPYLTLPWLIVVASAAQAAGSSWAEASRSAPERTTEGAYKAATADPTGDTLGTGSPRIDITNFSAQSTAEDLWLTFDFAALASAPDSGLADAVTGFIDLDVDRNAATGSRPLVDFVTGFTAGLGNELHVALATYSSDDGLADLVDEATETAIGRVPVAVTGPSMSIRIPLTMMGGDGAVHTAAVLGTLGEATDVVPNGGFLATTSGGGGGSILLNRDRFRVDVTWRDFAGATGSGQVSVRSDDSAVIYFFDADNWELLVKVLDACGLNSHYWVFAAATTDVAYTLTITDTQTGRVKVYSNPLGTAAAAVTDTGAFATCP